MLDNVSATTIADRELEAMSSTSKATLVAKLDKSLNANVNKVVFFYIFCLRFFSNTLCLFLFQLISFMLITYSQHVKQAIPDEKHCQIVKDALEMHLKDNSTKSAEMIHMARKSRG